VAVLVFGSLAQRFRAVDSSELDIVVQISYIPSILRIKEKNYVK